nr:MAG TPA: Initiation control protein YabA [Caudoviricetes sp.]
MRIAATSLVDENNSQVEIRLFALYGACGGFHVCLYVGNKRTHTG